MVEDAEESTSLLCLPVGACEECGPLELRRENKAQRATRTQIHYTDIVVYISVIPCLRQRSKRHAASNIKTSTTTNGDNNGAGGAPGK